MLGGIAVRAEKSPPFLFTPEVEAQTGPIWETVKARVTPLED
jgi:hypothetical protein